jgi:hypothetical protein
MEIKSKMSLQILVLIIIFGSLFLFYSWANADCEQEYYDAEDSNVRDDSYLDCKEDEAIDSAIRKQDEYYYSDENLEFDLEEKEET